MKSRCLNLLTGLGLFASLCLSSSSADALLASVKALGMAATAVAYPQDALVGAFNPAGMVDVGDRFDAGLSWEHVRGHIKIKNNVVTPLVAALNPVFAGFIGAPNPLTNGKFNAFGTKDFFNPDFGINKMIGCDISVGFVAYNRDFSKVTFHQPQVLLGNTKAGLEYIHEVAAPTVAVKFLEIHNLGVSANIHFQRFKVNGIQNFDHAFNPLFGGSAHPGHVTNNKYAYSTGLGVTVGYRCQILPCLSVGIAYSPKVRMRKFHRYSGFLSQHGKFDVPEIWTAGIAWRFHPNATVAFDYQYTGWERIKALHNPLLNSAGTLNALGADNGPGFGWTSSNFYRFGVDYDINECLTVRAGFRYSHTPIRRSQTAVNTLTMQVIESFLTCGATYSVTEADEVSFFYAHGFANKVKGHHSIPDFLGGGETDLYSYTDLLGFAWGHRF
jgi:long-chain fatty acid transport protein